MPTYIYGCHNKFHPRETLVHGMADIVETYCSVCGGRTHKIPQPFLWGANPLSLLQAWGERNWSKKLRNEPREERYDDVRTDRGKPQRDFGARK